MILRKLSLTFPNSLNLQKDDLGHLLYLWLTLRIWWQPIIPKFYDTRQYIIKTMFKDPISPFICVFGII